MCAGLLIFHHHRMIARTLHHAQNYLDRTYTEKPLVVFAIMFASINLIIILNVGFQTSVSVLFCLVINNFWLSFASLMVCKFTADVIMFYVAEALVCPCLIRRLRSTKTFVLIQRESQRHPYKGAFVTRFLFLSTGTKNILLRLVDTPFVPYITSALTFNLTFVLMILLISQDITQIHQLGKDQHPGKSMSVSQKLLLVVSIFVGVFTVVVMGVFFFWVRMKLKEEAPAPVPASDNGQEIQVISTSDDSNKIDTK